MAASVAIRPGVVDAQEVLRNDAREVAGVWYKGSFVEESVFA